MNIQHLREKIRKRSEELNIRPDHGPDGHWYLFEDERYTSVTTRLQVLKDPSLSNWKLNRGLGFIKDWILKADMEELKLMNKGSKDLDDLIAEAKLAPQLEFEGAGDIGSRVHEWREKWFNSAIATGEINGTFKWIGNEDIKVISACRAIKNFVETQNYIPLACELYVADHKTKTAGTLDDIGILNGELVMLDLKTSNIADKDSYTAQVCLYLSFFRKLYRLYPKKVYILHVSKSDGSYELIEVKNVNENIRWAKKVIEVSQGLDRVREEKKKKPILL